MYLHKRHYVGNKYREEAKLVRIIVPKDQEGVFFPTKNIKDERVSEIVEEIGYWRKANAIHNWFVQNVQKGKDDCRAYSVSTDDLRKLLSVVTGFYPPQNWSMAMSIMGQCIQKARLQR